MKKIALAAAAMGGTALIAFGASGTFAAFTDAEQTKTSSGAGTLDLTLNSGAVVGAPKPLALAPGESTTQAFWVNNAGTVAGALTAALTINQDAERGCQEPETTAVTGFTPDNTCDEWWSGGEFSKYAQVQFLDSEANTAADCATSTTGAESWGRAVTLKDAAVAPAPIGDLAGGAGNCIVLKVTLPGNVGNDVQSDTAEIGFAATLAQPTTPRAGNLSGPGTTATLN
ncbi:TasA family protein [Geodermatophilus sp. SYSU D00705]